MLIDDGYMNSTQTIAPKNVHIDMIKAQEKINSIHLPVLCSGTRDEAKAVQIVANQETFLPPPHTIQMPRKVIHTKEVSDHLRLDFCLDLLRQCYG